LPFGLSDSTELAEVSGRRLSLPAGRQGLILSGLFTTSLMMGFGAVEVSTSVSEIHLFSCFLRYSFLS
jgi:hypothetical protein